MGNTNKRNKRYRRLITGGSVSWLGVGIDATLVPSEAQHCQVLVDHIDDKDVFVVPVVQENGGRVLDSVDGVRKLATSTKSLVESLEVREEVSQIATACRDFMRDYEDGMDPQILGQMILALRANVGESVAFLTRILSLDEPSRLDFAAYEPRALGILEGWLE